MRTPGSLLAVFARWLGLDEAGAAQAARLALAAWLAFSIAALLHVQNAYWAAMPIWVVAQPSRGLLLERALYRLLGTLLGALAGFVVLTQGSSLLQLTLLAALIALCTGMTHLLRGTSAYAWLMAGMTAAVVVIPSALSPQDSWALALARVECTLIGVLAVTLVLWLFTPKTRRGDFYRRARALAADAVDFAGQSLTGNTDPATELRILKALSDIDGAARPISAGSLRGYRNLRHIDQLLLASLNIMTAGQAMGSHLHPEAQAAAALASRLQQVAERLRSDEPADSILPAPPENLPPRRLARLEQALEQLCQAAAQLAPAASPGPGEANAAPALVPDRDWRLALRSATTTGGAALACAFLAQAYPSQATELAILGVCIFSMLLGSMAQPQKHAPHMLLGVLAGVTGATLYRFAVQPHVDGMLELVLTLLPFLLVGGILRASRRFAVPAIDANMCFMLASQAGMPAVSSDAIISSSVALLLGAGLVGCGFLLFPRTVQRALRLTTQAILGDIQTLLRDTKAISRERWLALAGRRILRLLAHMGTDTHSGTTPPAGLLTLLNLGQSIIDLHHLGQQPGHRAIYQEAIARLADFERQPQATAEFLLHLAEDSRDRWLTVTLQTLAHALLASRSTLLAQRPGVNSVQ